MSQITAAPPHTGSPPPSILYHPHSFALRVWCCVGGASCFSIKRVLLAGSTRNTRGPRTGRRMSDEDAPSLTASAPEFVDELPPYTTDAAVQPVQQQVNRNELPLPFLLEEWCARGMLGDDTAPLVAMLAWAQRENEDEQEAAGWAAVGIQCEQSGRALQMQPEPLEAAEREASRAADAQLGAGPVAVSLAPAMKGLAATPTVRALPVAEPRYGTFGSGRDESVLPWGMRAANLEPFPDTMRAGSVNAYRFRLPGPGSYSPAQDGRPYRLEAGGAKHTFDTTWAKQDRYEQLAATNRPKGQYHCLPLRCGPAPGFYSNPTYGAGGVNRCSAKFFKRSFELPAGQPPERNRINVATVRLRSKLSNEGPAPWDYNTIETLPHNGQFFTRNVGRFSSAPASPYKATASGAACQASADSSPGREGVVEEASAGLAIHRGKGGLKKQQIGVQAKAIERDARNRRLDQRSRAVVEEELDRVRQAHRLVAAGSKRTIAGRKQPKLLKEDGSHDVGAVLKARLDGSLQRMSDLFKGLDSSWDGLVSKEEFADALNLLQIPATPEELDSVFSAIDADGSGEIDFKELKRHLMGWKASAGASLVVPGKCSSSTAAASRTGTWSISAGRSLPTTLLQGIEPPERRSVGPAGYDPRRASAFVRPNLGLGGAPSKEVRDYTRQMIVDQSDGTYIHKSLDLLVEQQDPQAEARMASRPASRGSPPRSAPGSARDLGPGTPSREEPRAVTPGSRARVELDLADDSGSPDAPGTKPSPGTSPSGIRQPRKVPLHNDVVQGTIPALSSLY